MIGATFTASMARCALLCAALCAPLVARAAVAAADSTNAPAKEDVPPPGTGQPTTTGGPAASSVDLDFDLLGAPAPPPAPSGEAHRLHTRRTMLSIHQGMGLTLLASTLSLTVVGQLNYTDRFGHDAASTAKYQRPHAVLAYTTLGLFAATGLMALFAPSPFDMKSQGVDRVTLHKVGLFTAAAGMAGQAVLGIWTRTREGYVNQKPIATAHLVLGYVTATAMVLGLGPIVF